MYKKLNKMLQKDSKKIVPLVLTQTKLLSQETLNSFKNLKNDFGENFFLNTVRNNEILEKIKVQTERPMKFFNFEQDEKILNKMRFNYKIREKFLWDGYLEIETEITKKKEFVNEIRKFLADLADKKKRISQDVFFN